jgi:hypothetical protein
VSVTVTKIEDDIQIMAWGQWARPRIERMLGAKSPGWVELVKSGAGWADKESPPPVYARAPDEYCEALDRMIAAMGPDVVRVMVALYCFRRSLNAVSRASGMSKQRVMQLRDSALNQLYGALYLKNIA